LALAELLADLSLVTDLGVGQPPESALRTCLLATRLARTMDVPDDAVATTFYTALLLRLGCTAYAHETATQLGGDDIAVRRAGVRTDFADRRQVVLGFLPEILAGTATVTKARILVSFARHGRRLAAESGRADCEVASATARRLDLPVSVSEALSQLFETWTGTGTPQGLRGEAIALPVRITHVAATGVLFARLGGAEHAVTAVRRRAGKDLDPAIAQRFCRQAPDLLAEPDAGDVRTAVLDAEPWPRRLVDQGDVDRIAAAFGDLVDLKSPYFLGHSAGVADLAVVAAHHLRLTAGEIATLRRAALLHDLGRAGVPNGIWDKRSALSTGEWEQVRLHAYHSERILTRSPVLAPAGRQAGLHHERLDGSGYHRQAAGPGIPMPARILAAADAYQAMRQPRPHRAALPPQRAAELLRHESKEGRLDAEAVGAVLVAAGVEQRVRRAWPAGLSDREVEVLRLLAAGCSAPEIARRLVIAPKTVAHHVQHIYTKLGVSTRAAAALFAMEHGLLTEETRDYRRSL
jgi:HD-GYP domain-containing protein (c-di-GMP phosphodiesterase class II)/DNA-binding CsgD family transcriptional regulator